MILQKARVKYADSDLAWHDSVKLELDCQNEKIAQHLLSRALQQCPESGLLWALAIRMEPAQSRMRKSTDAVSKLKNDVRVFMEIGVMFWVERKMTKAKKFLLRATELDKDNGDAWVYYYKFMLDQLSS